MLFRSQSTILNEELRALNFRQAGEITRLKLQVDTVLRDIYSSGRVIQILKEDIKGLQIQLDTSILQNAILLPFTFDKKDEWLDLKGSFDSWGSLDLSLNINADLDVWTGIDKTTNRPTVKITTDCTYLNTLSVNSFKMDTYKIPFYNKGWFRATEIGVAIIGGMILTK